MPVNNGWTKWPVRTGQQYVFIPHEKRIVVGSVEQTTGYGAGRGTRLTVWVGGVRYTLYTEQPWSGFYFQTLNFPEPPLE